MELLFLKEALQNFAGPLSLVKILIFRTGLCRGLFSLLFFPTLARSSIVEYPEYFFDQMLDYGRNDSYLPLDN